MRKRKKETALDWETLRLGIERCDLDLLIDFYAEDARLSIVNAAAPHASLFELGGKGEIAKHLRVTFGPEVSHRVEREAFIGGDRMTFRESCDYPDGGRVVVESTLEVSDSTRSTPAWACPARKNLSRNSPRLPRPVRKPSSAQPPYSTPTKDSGAIMGSTVVGSMTSLPPRR